MPVALLPAQSVAPSISLLYHCSSWEMVSDRWTNLFFIPTRKPQKVKVKAQLPNPAAAPGTLKKKKGFLPETKKRKNWKKKKTPTLENEQIKKENPDGKSDEAPKATSDRMDKKKKKKFRKRKKTPKENAAGNTEKTQEPPAKKSKKKSDGGKSNQLG